LNRKAFSTDREAKEYLVGRIAAEAEREAIVLSEIERKMLYFSETDWTLPDMSEVSGVFDRDYDQDEYEQTIGALVDKILTRDEAEAGPDQEAWDLAVLKLSEGDHYLQILIDAASRRKIVAQFGWRRWLPVFLEPGQRQPGDRLKLWVAAIIGVFLLLAAFWLVAVFRS
jgi:hypothetical protein